MLADLTIKGFLAETSGNAPVPGGGSISALSGAIASALTEMVSNLTIGKKKYSEVENEMKDIATRMAVVRDKLIENIDRDSETYNRVFEAFKLPKRTEEEKAKRSDVIQEATKEAAMVPMSVAEEIISIMPSISEVAHKGNQNAVTDACVAMMAARTGVLGALLNVRINLSSIKDSTFVERMTTEANTLERRTIAMEKELLDWVKTVLLYE
ncbi:MAG: cyclodeaminase/cyclohydrolase family protein [Parabacteroides sp.]|mgnify:CR=1 FL=1